MSKKSTIVRTIRITTPLLSALAPGLAARWLVRLFTTPTRRRVRPREEALVASADRDEVRLGDLRLPIYRWGDGPTVLLVHGWSGSAAQMSVLALPLVERGFRVVAFDGPGHGEADGRFSSLPLMALAVQRVGDVLGPLHAIVGHSMGTAATTLAVSRGVGAGRLVYLAPPEDLPGYLIRLAAYLGFSPAIAPRAQRRLERRFGVPFEQARGGYLAPTRAEPLLVVHDEGDREVPLAEGRRIAERWPGARLVVTRGYGHNRILRQLGVIEATVDFVAASSAERQAIVQVA